MRGKRKNIVFFLISFILLSFLMIANKLYNFSTLIFNFLSFHPDEAWIDLYTNLLLVSLAALITLLLFIITLREDRVEIEEPKIQDKDFMSNLVDEMPVFFVTLNKDGTTRYINKTMLIATGFQISEVAQRSFEEIFIIPEQQKMIQNIMLSLHKEDKPTYNDNIILTKDGQELWVRWYSRSVFNDSGEMQYYISIGVDITAQRKSEDELDKKQKIEQLLFKTIPTGIVFRDKSGRIDYLNEWGEELLGVKLEELKGKKFNELQWTICDLEGNPLTDEKQSFGLVEKSLKPLYGLEQLLKWPDEKINGSGYPRGLKGDEIMLEARILLVADVYEAMSSHRPYRPALSRAEAEEELEKNKGILYDPEVVDACLQVIRRNPVLSSSVLSD